MNIGVIGGANIDITAKPIGKLNFHDSNLGKISMSLGGVGRNIAHNLCLLGQNVYFFSAIADDLYSQTIRSHCKQIGLKLDYSLSCKGESSSTYLCMSDEEGDMLVAVNDMELMEKVTPNYLESVLDVLNSLDVVVFDLNLPEDSISYIISHVKAPLFVDTVSCVKTEKLLNVLKSGIDASIDTIKTNKYEAEVLSSHSISCDEDLQICAKILHKMGIHHVCITLGSQGVFYSDDGIFTQLPNPPGTKIVNATGAGDAFISGLVYAYMHKDVKEKLGYGLSASRIALESNHAVSDEMSENHLNEIFKKINI